MNSRVAILTPDASGGWHQSRWPDVFARLAAPLEETGLEVKGLSWTSGSDLSAFDLVMPLLTWGYHRDADWQAQVAAWEARGVPLQNPPSVLRWNADKAYLGKLEQRGAPITPTVFIGRIDETVLASAARRFGTDHLVVKPRISAGAFQTIRWSPGAPLADAPDGEAMIQPYLPAVEETGEISLIYLGGRYSHAVSKRPQPGDFRVQPEYDGIIAAHEPSPDERAVAEAVLEAAAEDLLYARIDLVRDVAGRPVLMELELVEPDLYLEYDPQAPQRFAKAVGDSIRRSDRSVRR